MHECTEMVLKAELKHRCHWRVVLNFFQPTFNCSLSFDVITLHSLNETKCFYLRAKPQAFHHSLIEISNRIMTLIKDESMPLRRKVLCSKAGAKFMLMLSTVQET
jgi:hypothetical protein